MSFLTGLDPPKGAGLDKARRTVGALPSAPPTLTPGSLAGQQVGAPVPVFDPAAPTTAAGGFGAFQATGPSDAFVNPLAGAGGAGEPIGFPSSSLESILGIGNVANGGPISALQPHYPPSEASGPGAVVTPGTIVRKEPIPIKPGLGLSGSSLESILGIGNVANGRSALPGLTEQQVRDRQIEDFVRGLDPRIQKGVDLTLGDTLEERKRQIRAQQDALATLADQQTRNNANFDRFLESPTQRGIMDELLARSTGEVSAISGVQEQAALAKLAQGFASQSEAQEASRGARGTTFSGAGTEIDAALDALFRGQGLQVSASIAGINESAKASALAAITSLDLEREKVILAHQQQQGILASQIATVEQNVDFEPIDFVAFEQLDIALEQFDLAMEQAMQDRDFVEGQAQFGFADLMQVLVSFLSIPNVLGGLFG